MSEFDRRCDRPGCTLPAAYSRWRADATKNGANHNEPGMTEEFLCIAHANEVRQYLGGRLQLLIGWEGEP